MALYEALYGVASVDGDDAAGSHGRRARRDGAPRACRQQGAVVGAQDRAARPSRRTTRPLAVDDRVAPPSWRRAGSVPRRRFASARGGEAGRYPGRRRCAGAPATRRWKAEVRSAFLATGRRRGGHLRQGPRDSGVPLRAILDRDVRRRRRGDARLRGNNRPTSSTCAWPGSKSASTGARASQAFREANAEVIENAVSAATRSAGSIAAPTSSRCARWCGRRVSSRTRRGRSPAHAVGRGARAPPRRPPQRGAERSGPLSTRSAAPTMRRCWRRRCSSASTCTSSRVRR